MLDYQGNQIPGGKYSFKDKAIPTDRWCLKADYAESSMAHNTGVARLWNDHFRDVLVDGEYRCRTEAQQTVIDNGYNYDVRTAIDGFPIVVFYRQTYNDSLICLGQYNFNNDKSSHEVYGFENVPEFDNSVVGLNAKLKKLKEDYSQLDPSIEGNSDKMKKMAFEYSKTEAEIKVLTSALKISSTALEEDKKSIDENNISSDSKSEFTPCCSV